MHTSAREDHWAQWDLLMSKTAANWTLRILVYAQLLGNTAHCGPWCYSRASLQRTIMPLVSCLPISVLYGDHYRSLRDPGNECLNAAFKVLLEGGFVRGKTTFLPFFFLHKSQEILTWFPYLHQFYVPYWKAEFLERKSNLKWQFSERKHWELMSFVTRGG